MDKKLEEAIKILEYFITEFDEEEVSFTQVEKAIKTVLNHIENSISKEVIEEKIEKATEEYKYFLDNIDRKTSHMKDEHKIRATYAEFGVKRGKLEILQELLEGK